jgi:hypothetical protein
LYADILLVRSIHHLSKSSLLHQHDYSHHPQGKPGVWHGEEASNNARLASSWRNSRRIRDATEVLTGDLLLFVASCLDRGAESYAAAAERVAVACAAFVRRNILCEPTHNMTDKWGRRLFKTGGVVLILLGLVHSISLFRKMAGSTDTERQLIGLMDSYQFNLMGSMRSMADLLQGFSMAFMLAALGMGVMDLAVARERAGSLKRVALVNVIWLAAMKLQAEETRSNSAA